MIVLDASALLAFLWGEAGASKVQAAFDAPEQTVCTVANWAEVATKVFAKAGDWTAAEMALAGFGLEIVPITADDAVAAARLWLKHRNLSLGDRICIAAAQRLGALVYTADRAWADVPDAQINVLR
ncbi:MAG: type II toxin-antitoxin system VapC family toxin [Propionibacteriaceae bacterium]|jgi:PIN domain nuclease of toxin-antitoxin system|nr:type II toxin-antitoxin system VapC family toxin [Propionibacteriaceae bacterium]